MLLQVEDELDIDGMTIGEFIGDTVENFMNSGFQAGVAILAFAITLAGCMKAKLNPVISFLVAFGALWAGWLGYNTVKGEDNPLFPGTIQANELWDSLVQDGTAFLIAALAVSLVFVLLAKTSLKWGFKLVIAIGTLFAASFVYNLLESWQSV